MSMHVAGRKKSNFRRRDTGDVQGQRSTPKARVGTREKAGTPKRPDGFEAQAAGASTPGTGLAGGGTQRAGWRQEAPLIQQAKGSDDCGAACMAMLLRATGKGEGKADAQLVKELDDSVGGKGVTPYKLGEALAKNGLLVTDAQRSYSPSKLKEMLASGHKFIAKVDTGRLEAADEGPLGKLFRDKGASHYVVVDGMDDKGRLLVKDPLSSSTYKLTPQQLDYATGANRDVFGAIGDALRGTSRGGLMAIHPDENALQKWQAGMVDDQIAAGRPMDNDISIGARRRLTEMF